MYLAGIGAYERLWLFDPPGSANCPPDLVNGCYNTGQSPGCGDPQQFATFANLQAYAKAKGETLRQVASADEAFRICNTKPPTIEIPAPQTQRTSQPGTTILPTGKSTPTAAQVITLPGTQTTIIQPADNKGESLQAAGLSDFMPLIMGSALVVWFISRRGR